MIHNNENQEKKQNKNETIRKVAMQYLNMVNGVIKFATDIYFTEYSMYHMYLTQFAQCQEYQTEKASLLYPLAYTLQLTTAKIQTSETMLKSLKSKMNFLKNMEIKTEEKPQRAACSVPPKKKLFFSVNSGETMASTLVTLTAANLDEKYIGNNNI
jgi:hypothetical protein